jgi:hypothetical protein
VYGNYLLIASVVANSDFLLPTFFLKLNLNSLSCGRFFLLQIFVGANFVIYGFFSHRANRFVDGEAEINFDDFLRYDRFHQTFGLEGRCADVGSQYLVLVIKMLEIVTLIRTRTRIIISILNP